MCQEDVGKRERMGAEMGRKAGEKRKAIVMRYTKRVKRDFLSQ